MAVTEPVGLLGPALDLGLDAEGDLQGQRRQGVEHEGGDGVVHAGTGNPQTSRHPHADGGRHAGVVGHLDVAPGVIAHGHASPAAPANGQALQEGGALPGGTGAALGPMRLGRGQELGLVRLEGLPVDVAGNGRRG